MITNPIRILIVDDLKTICEGLKEMLSQPEFEIVDFASNGMEAIEKTEKTRPDIVLIDVLMPIMDGIKATFEITNRFTFAKVIVISSFKSERMISQAVSAGAKGYLSKKVIAEELSDAIRNINSGAVCFAAPTQLALAPAISRTVNQKIDIFLPNLKIFRSNDLSIEIRNQHDQNSWFSSELLETETDIDTPLETTAIVTIEETTSSLVQNQSKKKNFFLEKFRQLKNYILLQIGI